MTNDNDKILELDSRLSLLISKHQEFTRDINLLKSELSQLKFDIGKNTITKRTTETPTSEPFKNVTVDLPQKEYSSTKPSDLIRKEQKETQVSSPKIQKTSKPIPSGPTNFEKFIGENLISKIGIIILVIGISIGAKYSIENNLISPLTRIVMGYIAGVALLVKGFQLKKKYLNYSAVLVSGAIATLYIVTYLGFNLYGLYPQAIAFALMVCFTIFTVFTAIQYDRQVIALFGLVGAYAVPFLVGGKSGNHVVFLSYIALINIGMLAVSFKKYWKLLLKASFILTWAIFFTWFASKYDNQIVWVGVSFLIFFFGTFYAAILYYKFANQKEFAKTDIALMFANAFIFYGLGFGLLDQLPYGDQFLGLYTLINAIIHFVVGFILYRNKKVDQNIFRLAIGLVLIFISIAIPVQFEAKVTAILWAGQAAALFWVGRTKGIYFYERLSYPLMLLSSSILSINYLETYGDMLWISEHSNITFLWNTQFLISVLFITTFGFINYLKVKHPNTLQDEENKNVFSSIMHFAIPLILTVFAYLSIYLEINYHFEKLYDLSKISLLDGVSLHNVDILLFKQLWLIFYSLTFGTIAILINQNKIKNESVSILLTLFLVVSMGIFTTLGLENLGSLRDNYLVNFNAEYYTLSYFHIGIRYIGILLIGISLWALQKVYKGKAPHIVDIFSSLVILTLVSNEYINWMTIYNPTASFKLGLSILWGVMALLSVIIGISKNKKHLRVSAFVLFGITLLKLFFYDLTSLDTISKTIVFVALGILLLIISFLYNKFKNKIDNEDHEQMA